MPPVSVKGRDGIRGARRAQERSGKPDPTMRPFSDREGVHGDYRGAKGVTKDHREEHGEARSIIKKIGEGAPVGG